MVAYLAEINLVTSISAPFSFFRYFFPYYTTNKNIITFLLFPIIISVLRSICAVPADKSPMISYRSSTLLFPHHNILFDHNQKYTGSTFNEIPCFSILILFFFSSYSKIIPPSENVTVLLFSNDYLRFQYFTVFYRIIFFFFCVMHDVNSQNCNSLLDI